MSERLFQRPKSTKLNYGKQRFLIDSPTELQAQMHDRIKWQLRQLHRHNVDLCTTAFQLPQELHFIPLYENMLFNMLITFHNNHSTPHSFVHPKTFILLDNETSNLIPTNTGANLPMELLSDHESKHWFDIEYDKQNKNGPNTPNTIIYKLYWEKIHKMKYETLMLEANIETSVAIDSHFMGMISAPNYPSEHDLANLESLSSQMDIPHKILNKINAFLTRRIKAHQQGLSFIKKPVNLEQATNSTTRQWKKNNLHRIRMDVYP